MGNSDQSQKRLTPREELQELFSKCKEEADFSTEKLRQAREAVVQGAAFRRLLVLDCDLDAPPQTDDSTELKLKRIAYYSSLYQELRNLIKKSRNTKTLWWVVATWLRDEGLCQPRDFLPRQIYKKLTADAQKQLGAILNTDFRHYRRIEAWRPYFQMLLDERKRLDARANSTRALIDAGYDEKAVQAALRKHRPVPAICEWLASVEGGDATTLKNAHAKVANRLDKRHKNPHPNL